MDKKDAIGDNAPGEISKPGVTATKKPSPLMLEEYNFYHKRRGKCVIINNRYFQAHTGQLEREGTDLDAETISTAFQDIGFEVERCDNMSALDLSIKLREVSNEDHEDADCFACVILSHGKSGKIYATDSQVEIDSLTKHFKGDACQSLAGKPKLFFIQACRGTKLDYGVDIDAVDAAVDTTEDSSVRTIPTEADFLIAYSVVPGFYSWRNNVDGSWFIQALCRVLTEHGQVMELMNLMTLVNKLVAYDFASCSDEEWSNNMKQMPCMVSMLTKLVYFYAK